ncbi:MAG: family ATPase [Actinomycetia bacterium]|nr:family ATPase [Actinomycetes bacterium]
MPHPELADERAHLQLARVCLEQMRARTASKVDRAEILAANEADAEAVRWQLQRRLASFDDESTVLCFGRIDEEHGPVFYIGRRHIEDERGAPMVVDWRADVATPFYRATLSDPMGLHRRRRFVFSGRDLSDIFEEDFDDPDSLAGSGGVPDPLLAELGRARTGQMRDIVATIQHEQDVIIRAPLERCIVVQGGPGTGKTAVGLHRAAFLLYEHRRVLARDGVLVVGPNPLFLSYIAQVLPSLGETSATQATVDQLLGMRFRIVAIDDEPTARVKGDARMATLIERACDAAIQPPDDDVQMRVRGRTVRVPAVEVHELIAAMRKRDAPFSVQRIRFREQLIRRVHVLVSGGEPSALEDTEFASAVLAEAANRQVIDRCWRAVNAATLVRSLLTQRATLARAAGGLLTDDEQALVLRARPKRGEAEPWTIADLPLLDEAEAQVKGAPRRYGHLVVDEAQDLSPMQLRMLARRAIHHSMTVLGDLAQATAPAAATSWTTVLDHFGRPANADVNELSIGYRLPGAILDFANRLLPEAAPEVVAAASVRETGDPPDIRRFAAAELVTQSAQHVVLLAEDFATTAVVTPLALLDDMRAAIADAGGDVAGPDEDALTHRITVLPAALAKGLEFDAVLVLEPGAIVAESDHGVRLLFVALTRAVQHLAIAHATPLPPALS